MMSYKKFIPAIYLYKGNAVKNRSDMTVISYNPTELAKSYSDNMADEILIFDLSSNDEEHEESLSVIREIARIVEVPLLGAGNIKRMEDVKKILYAGCKKAILNLKKEESFAILEEVSLKFGKAKIAASFDAIADITNRKEELCKYISELVLLRAPILKEAVTVTDIPLIAALPEISLEKMLEVLSLSHVSGITGDIVNENVKEIHALKKLGFDNGIEVNTYTSAMNWAEFKLNNDGMLPVVVQDYKTNEVLMVAYMNEEAYHQTLETGKMTYFSRSRNELWLKGDTSGHYQYVKALYADCDADTLLAKVSQVGAACHTGKYSCFFNEILKKDYDDTNPLTVFEHVFNVIKDRKINPKEGSYTNYLFDKGIDKILKKLGEEATEIVIASKNPNADEIKYEISDFLYHMMVLMVEKNVTWEEIMTELAQR